MKRKLGCRDVFEAVVAAGRGTERSAFRASGNSQSGGPLPGHPLIVLGLGEGVALMVIHGVDALLTATFAPRWRSPGGGDSGRRSGSADRPPDSTHVYRIGTMRAMVRTCRQAGLGPALSAGDAGGLDLLEAAATGARLRLVEQSA